MRLAAGDAIADSEAGRMIAEKVEAQTAARLLRSEVATAAKSRRRFWAFIERKFVETGVGLPGEPCGNSRLI
jgi:hypothetical protein